MLLEDALNTARLHLGQRGHGVDQMR